MNIRQATVEDIALLIQLRIDYLIEDRGSLSCNEEMVIRQQLEKYFAKHISDHTFYGILAEADFRVVSVAFLVISEKPANPSFISGKTGTLLNVLTYPEYRQKGLATKVLEKTIKIAKQNNLSYIDLSATDAGIPLYEKLGFNKSISNYTQMQLPLT